jgi:hypothetical protein
MPADFYLFLPVLMFSAVTESPCNKPAGVTALELPGRALDSPLRGTFFNIPARFRIFVLSPFTGEKI